MTQQHFCKSTYVQSRLDDSPLPLTDVWFYSVLYLMLILNCEGGFEADIVCNCILNCQTAAHLCLWMLFWLLYSGRLKNIWLYFRLFSSRKVDCATKSEDKIFSTLIWMNEHICAQRLRCGVTCNLVPAHTHRDRKPPWQCPLHVFLTTN